MSDPEITALREQLASRQRSDDYRQMRKDLDALGLAFGHAADVAIEKTVANGVPAEWTTTPNAARDTALLYFHGGGYVIGSINTHRALAGRISRAAKARVLVIDSRLAPEHPHPAAVEDAVAAYRWMLQQGLQASRIAVSGDSAGGGLTVAALVAIRDANLPMPAAGAPISPWVDMEGIGDSMTSKSAADPIVQKEGLLNMARAYLGGKHPRTPLAAPLYADLSGLPPLLIQVGTAETLLDDASRLAERAKKAGVDVSYEPWDNMVHVWHLFAPMLDEGKQAIDGIGAFVQKHT